MCSNPEDLQTRLRVLGATIVSVDGTEIFSELWCYALKVAWFPNQSLGDVGTLNGLSCGFNSAKSGTTTLSDSHSNFFLFAFEFGDQ